MNTPPAYSQAEIAVIAGWLGDGLSAAQIALRFSRAYRPVSRNSIIGIVFRNPVLKAIGFERDPTGGPRRVLRKDGWTEAQAATAEEMWARGCSAAEIAAAIGRTARSVNAYALDHRAAVRSTAAEDGQMLARLRRGDHRPAPVKLAADLLPPTRTEARAYDAASLRLMLADLGWRDCKFPVNDALPGEPHLFCGRPAEAGAAYCPHHRMRCRGAGTRGENDAARTLVRAGRAA